MDLRTLAGPRRAGALAAPAAFLLILGAVAPAQGQTALGEPRWLPWLGCWAPNAASPAVAPELANVERLCVFPDEASGVQLATIVEGKIDTRASIPSAGVKHPVVRDGCEGWQQATWAREGRRLYRRTELACEGGARHVTSGMLALVSASDWIEIEVASVAGQQQSVRIVRYREAPDTTDAVRVVIGSLAGRSLAMRSARMAAAAVPTIDEVIEASRAVDPAVVEAWLVHRRPPFDVSARELARMSEAGVSTAIIDVVVELSHPGVAGGRLGSGAYAVARLAPPRPAVTTVSLGNQQQPLYEPTALTATGGGAAWAPTYYYRNRYYYFYGFDRWGFLPYSYYGLYPFGGLGVIYRTGLFAYPRHTGYTYPYDPYYPYYPSYPNRYYPPSQPQYPPKSRGTVIVMPPRRTNPPATPSPSEPPDPGGRAVNGRGYTVGGTGGGTAVPSAPPPPDPTSDRSARWGGPSIPPPPPPRSTGGSSSGSSGSQAGRENPSVPRTATPRGGQPSQTAAPPPERPPKTATQSTQGSSTSGSSSSGSRTAKPRPPGQ